MRFSFFNRRLTRPAAVIATALATALACLVAVLPASAATASAAASAQANPLSEVNPFIGTENQGNTFPGATAPFGMVQVSPDNGGQATGYGYDGGPIYGFSQTHLSGAGCGVDGEIPFMPTTGAVTTADPSRYASAFSHDTETAQPGYYSVNLSTYGIKAELTATTRTGWQRYTYPSTGQQNVLINTGKSNMTVFDSGIAIVGDDTVEGYVDDGHFCAGQDRHKVYFSAKFSRAFGSFGTWRGSTLTAGSRAASGSGGNGGWVSFGASAQPVTVKVGLSYTSVAGARANLAAETGKSFGFDATRQRVQGQWNRMLSEIDITGGTPDARTAFYTALYHSLLQPNVASDTGGDYTGFDGKVHRATDHTEYQDFSLWDTYRTQNQLLELLQPRVARDVDLSLLDVYRYGGWLPRWELDNSETNIMTGDPVTPFLVDAWSKGLLAGHEQEAYQALYKDATSTPPASSPYNGRNGNPWYNTRGYIPVGENCVYKGGDNDCQYPASATLEYSLSDAALSVMARGLGHTADAAMFARRAEDYRTLWDASIGFFRPRNADGSWVTPYDPGTGNNEFHESGAYQYQWLVPQDEPGMIGLLGGDTVANQRLDSFFVYGGLLTDPSETVKTGWVNSAYGYYGNSTYNPNNEPDLDAPYTYAWTGEPDHTATVVHAQETLFANAPDGMTGNDDLGEMSAWLVMSSIGLYPVMSGADYYAVTSPQFPRTVVRVGAFGGSPVGALGGAVGAAAAAAGAAAGGGAFGAVGAFGGQQGGTVVIDAPGTSWTNRYITGMTLDGRPQQQTWVSQDAIARGARIGYTLAASPGTWGTAPADAPPSVTSPPA